MAHDVFISYSSRDLKTVETIANCLESKGVRCWYADRDIPSGETWANSIVTALSQAKVFVLVFTDASNASEQVLREVNLADSHHLTIIPFKLTNKSPTNGMAYYLNTVHWLDAVTGDLKTSCETLNNMVLQNLGKATPGAAYNTVPMKKAAPNNAIALRIIAVVAALALLSGGVWLAYPHLPFAKNGAAEQPVDAPPAETEQVEIIPTEDSLTEDTLTEDAQPASTQENAAKQEEPALICGQKLTLGMFEQNNEQSAREALKWRVLSVQGDRALLITDKIIDSRPFDSTGSTTTWGNCSLRSWLNGEFYDESFSSEEKAVIIANEDTEDFVFLLSVDEAAEYFTNKADRAADPTAYAEAKQHSLSSGATSWWWLRSKGTIKKSVAGVYEDGTIDNAGGVVSHGYNLVRPAIWVDITLLRDGILQTGQ